MNIIREGNMHNHTIEFAFQVFQILMTTDEKHPLNAKQIMKRLKEYYNTDCNDRRKIYDVENLLMNMGFPIEKSERKNDGVYMSGTISLAEIKMLLDMLEQSKLLTEKSKNSLIAKLYDWMPEEYRRILRRMPRVRARYTTKDDSIRNYIDDLLISVHEQKQVDFLYLAYDLEMQPFFKHQMKYYHISPYMVYFSFDTCYLIGAENEPDEGIDKLKHFRLDRICNLSRTNRNNIRLDHYCNNPIVDLTDYVYRSINHYSGKEVRLKLEVPYSERAMYIIRDMCGTDYVCQKYNDNMAIISFRIRTGPTLIGWLMQNARLFKAVGPEEVVEAVKEEYRYGSRLYG